MIKSSVAGVIVIAALVTAACGGSDGTSKTSAPHTSAHVETTVPSPSPTSAAPKLPQRKVTDIYDLVTFAVASGIQCDGTGGWAEADNQKVMGLVGADAAMRCGDQAVVATFPNKAAMATLLANVNAPDAKSQGVQPVFVGGTWIVQADDARKLAKVAAGTLITP